jgi:hypothetical protein
MDDQINHPQHYNTNSLEAIDIICASMTEEEFKGYLKGNILKYLIRYKHKGHPDVDLKKARWYLDKLIGEIEDDI